MSAEQVLEASYTALLDALAGDEGDAAWAPTLCTGWSVQDLVQHLLGDAQRALVALHTPCSGPADVDEISYWHAWALDRAGADAGRRANRILASVWSFSALAALYVETAQAVLLASAERSGDEVVMTQGHRLTVAALRSTLAVEATVHQLDLGLGRPSDRGLAEVRHVLDGLLGHAAPIPDDARYALIGTGRSSLTTEESVLLGAAADRFPLFG